MSSEIFETVFIEPTYVRKSLAIAALAGSLVPGGIGIFMWNFGFNWLVAFGAGAAFSFLVYVLYRTYKRGLRQAIYLFPQKLVFDYITYKQEFAFSTRHEWAFAATDNDWKITSHKDSSSKQVPKAAFPRLEQAVISFYGSKTGAGLPSAAAEDVENPQQ